MATPQLPTYSTWRLDLTHALDIKYPQSGQTSVVTLGAIRGEEGHGEWQLRVPARYATDDTAKKT